MKDIMAAPLGELISSVGEGVAQAQASLDAASLAQTLEIYSDSDNPTIEQLRQIGYQPTFYVLPETVVEAQVSLALSTSTGSSNGGKVVKSPALPAMKSKVLGKTKVYAAPVNASVTNKYNLNANASTKLTFKIVPVPPAGDISEIRVVPNLNGKSIADTEEILNKLGLTYTITSGTTGNVTDQTPKAGEILKAGDTIEITVA